MVRRAGDKFSHRGRSNIDAIMPKIKGAVEERKTKISSNIDLSTAENWLIRPELMKLCKEAVNQDLTCTNFSYSRGFAGDPDLLDALAAFFNAHFGPHQPVLPAHLIVAPGASGCIDALLYNICNPGDGVLLPGPYWNGFDFGLSARSAAIPVVVPLPSFASNFDASELLSALETVMINAPIPIRALILTNPHNPLGICYPKDVLEHCLRFCQQYGIHFISDEVYALSQFPNHDCQGSAPFCSVLSLNLKDIGVDPSRTHIVWSMSKDFGQSGFRIGCAVSQSSEEMVIGVALATMQQVSSLSAICATHLLRSPKLEGLIKLNSERLSLSYQLLTSFFRSYGIPYTAGNAGLYVYAKLGATAETWEDEKHTVDSLKDVGLIVSPGRSYHGPDHEKGWMRVTFAVEVTVLEEAVCRIKQVISPLWLSVTC